MQHWEFHQMPLQVDVLKCSAIHVYLNPIMRFVWRVISAISLLVLVACSEPAPSEVKRLDSPVVGMFYTVETYFGQGAIDNDYTKVYLHLERQGKSVQRLVLSGTYVTVSRIDWSSPSENTIVFTGGYTDTFSNWATLSIDGKSEHVHVRLQEDKEPATGQR